MAAEVTLYPGQVYKHHSKQVILTHIAGMGYKPTGFRVPTDTDNYLSDSTYRVTTTGWDPCSSPRIIVSLI